MSDDVITLDSSDEETHATNTKKAGSAIKLAQDEYRSIVGPFPMSIPRPQDSPILSKSLHSKKFIPNRFPNKFPKKNFPIGIISPQNISGLNIPPGIQIKRKPNLQNQKYSLDTAPLHQRILSNSIPHLQVKSIRNNMLYSKSSVQNVTARQNGISASQKVIDTLPPGITITRTTGNNKISQKRRSPFNSTVEKKKPRVTSLCQIASVRSIPVYDLDDYQEHQYEVLPIEFEPDPDTSKTNIEDNFQTEVDHNHDSLHKDLTIKKKESNENNDSLVEIEIPLISAPQMKLEAVQDPLADLSINPVSEDVVKSNSPIASIVNTVLKEKNLESNKTETKNLNVEIENNIKETNEGDVECPKVHCESDKDLNVAATTVNVEADVDLAPASKPVIVKVMLGSKEDLQIAEILKKMEITKHIKPGIKAFDEPLTESYQKFVDLCLKLDTSADMKEIIDKKVLAYYRSVHPSFTGSKSFCELVEGKIKEMITNPGGIFLYIKAVVEELKVRRVKLKKEPPRKNHEKNIVPSTSKEEDHENEDELNGEDSRTSRHIVKLERALAKLNRAIQKLEEKEVDYDDENCSSYILADRYKARLVRVYDKLCSLTGERNAALRRTAIRDVRRLSLTCSRMPKLAEAVKAMAATKPYWFPDYPEVLACVEKCAKDQKLDMRPYEMQNEARLLFVEIGTMLQQRRQQKEYEDMSWRLGTDSDPADSDPALALALQMNREKSSHLEMEVINKFAEKQVKLKLEPENVGDIDSSSSESSGGENNNTDNEDECELSDSVIDIDEASQECAAVDSNMSKNKIADNPLLDENQATSGVKKSVELLSNGDSAPVRNVSPNILNTSKSSQKNAKLNFFDTDVMVQIHCIKNSPKKTETSATVGEPVDRSDLIKGKSEPSNVEISSDPTTQNSNESGNSRLSKDDANNILYLNNEKSKVKSSRHVTLGNVHESDDSADSFDSNPSLIEVSSSGSDEEAVDTEEIKEDSFLRLNTHRPESAMSGVDVIEDSNSMSKILTESGKILEVDDSD